VERVIVEIDFLLPLVMNGREHPACIPMHNDRGIRAIRVTINLGRGPEMIDVDLCTT